MNNTAIPSNDGGSKPNARNLLHQMEGKNAQGDETDYGGPYDDYRDHASDPYVGKHRAPRKPLRLRLRS